MASQNETTPTQECRMDVVIAAMRAAKERGETSAQVNEMVQAVAEWVEGCRCGRCGGER